MLVSCWILSASFPLKVLVSMHLGILSGLKYYVVGVCMTPLALVVDTLNNTWLTF